MMHICHVNLASAFSGGERQTLALIKQQVELGYQLTLIVNPKSPLVQELEKLNCHIILTTHYLKKHAKTITQNCDLIHVHEGRAIYWALIQSKLFNVPYLITRRIDNPLKRKWLSTLAYANAQALVGLSKEIVTQIALRHPTSNIYTIPSSPVIYSRNEHEIKQLKNKFQNKFIVIHAANMLKHKGFNITIDAAKIMRDKDTEVHFILLGDGHEKSALELQAKDLKNVTFAGKQSNMGDWFATANVLVHPSYSEGLGSVILEAIVAGLSVIGSNVGGIPDIIEHQKNGLLVESGNAQELASAILSIKNDIILKDKFKSYNENKMKKFNIEYTALQYEKIYIGMKS